MNIKEYAYMCKEWIKGIFCYPRLYIDASLSSDYNPYWKEKRGHNIGELSSWQKERADFILSVVGKDDKKQVTIADVGCGDGSILTYLKKNQACITRCVGYDSSEFALECARESGIETHTIDISKKESFAQLEQVDYYLLLETLEHIPHSEELLLHALGQSREGVFFSFPNTGYMTHRLRFLFGRFPAQWRILPNEHVRFWTYADLKWWLNALHIENYCIHCYKGIPILNKIFPSFFGAAFIVYIKKTT